MRNWIKRFIFICLSCLSIAADSLAGDTVKLTTLEWSPYTGSALTNNGFSSEIIQKALASQGVKSTITFQSWGQTLETVKAGKFNALFSAYYTRERIRQYLFTDPYAESVLLFYTRKGRHITYDSLEDLKGLRIGVIKGFTNTPEFDAADFLDKIEFDREEDALIRLVRGEVDLIVMDKYIYLHLLNKKFRAYKDDLTALAKPLDKKPLYLMFSRALATSPGLVKAFNRGIAAIRENGVYDLILRRHNFLPDRRIELVTLEWPPYAGQDMEDKGFVVDSIRKAFETVRYSVQLSFRPWARALSETEFGIRDVAFPSYFSEERNKKFALVPLDLTSDIGFMKIREDIPATYDSLSDLSPYRIGVVHGYVNRPDFDQAEGLKKVPAYSDLDNFQRLINGKLDLVVMDRRVAGYIARRTGAKVKFTFLRPWLDSKRLYLAFSRHAPDFKKKMAAFQYGYEELLQKGIIKPNLTPE